MDVRTHLAQQIGLLLIANIEQQAQIEQLSSALEASRKPAPQPAVPEQSEAIEPAAPQPAQVDPLDPRRASDPY